MIPIEKHQHRISEIDVLMNDTTIWNDPKTAATLMKDRQKLSDIITTISKFKEQTAFNSEFANAYPNEVNTVAKDVQKLYDEMCDIEFKQIMKDPIDNTAAILSINAGAGGLESANWVNMLLRMYVRYADANGFGVEILDEKHSEEHTAICIDSVSIRVDGNYAFGFLKGESGVHRLIRNSPFNANNTRQTSFAAVNVVPDIEDSIDIRIEEKDLEISTMRASGSGGQSVNKIESAVRIKHLPTGIIVNSRAESSQHTNRRFAMKMLKAKLYDYELKKKQAEEDKQISILSDISFGHQIRTTTLTPYSLVKDHRTGCEVNNAEFVLDGNIQELITSYLRFAATT